jgi:hypothetical protein
VRGIKTGNYSAFRVQKLTLLEVVTRPRTCGRIRAPSSSDFLLTRVISAHSSVPVGFTVRTVVISGALDRASAWFVWWQDYRVHSKLPGSKVGSRNFEVQGSAVMLRGLRPA